MPHRRRESGAVGGRRRPRSPRDDKALWRWDGLLPHHAQTFVVLGAAKDLWFAGLRHSGYSAGAVGLDPADPRAASLLQRVNCVLLCFQLTMLLLHFVEHRCQFLMLHGLNLPARVPDYHVRIDLRDEFRTKFAPGAIAR